MTAHLVAVVDVCRNHPGEPAETWADLDTPVGTIRVWLCGDCLDTERWPALVWPLAAELAIGYHSIDGHDPEHCSGCADDALLAARAAACCEEHVDAAGQFAPHVHGCVLPRQGDGRSHGGACRTLTGASL